MHYRARLQEYTSALVHGPVTTTTKTPRTGPAPKKITATWFNNTGTILWSGPARAREQIPDTFFDARRAIVSSRVGIRTPRIQRIQKRNAALLVANPRVPTIGPLNDTSITLPGYRGTSGSGSTTITFFPGAGPSSWSLSTPANVGRYQYMLVSALRSSGTVTDPSSVTGSGLTWTKVGSKVHSEGLQGWTLWRAPGVGVYSATTGLVAVTWSFSPTLSTLFVYDVIGAGGAEVQVVGGEGTATTAATWNLTNPPTTGCVLCAVACRNAGSATATARTGWYAGAGTTVFSGSGSSSTMYTSGPLNDQTVGGTFAGNQTWVGLAVEVKGKALCARSHNSEALLA